MDRVKGKFCDSHAELQAAIDGGGDDDGTSDKAKGIYKIKIIIK